VRKPAVCVGEFLEALLNAWVARHHPSQPIA
jgi:hypothetical protein